MLRLAPSRGLLGRVKPLRAAALPRHLPSLPVFALYPRRNQSSNSVPSASIPSSSSSSSPSTSTPSYTVQNRSYHQDDWSNAPPVILSKIGRNLHLTPNHPISILRGIIESHFAEHTSVTPSTPIVSVYQNFDELGFAPDHPGRSLTDSYYLNREHMLRTHTSAHEVETYRSGLDAWLLSADVYRRDEIDSSHYPVFHQMEGTQVWPTTSLHELPKRNAELAKQLADCPLVIEDPTTISDSNPYQASHDPEHAAQIAQHLKHSLNGLIFRLFGHTTQDGEPLKVRWIEAFFPFTTPSYEVEVWWNGEWLELLGCGVVMQKTLDQAGVSHKSGWAFGLGLERIAMVLFSIPDIRLFWSTDPRFLSQFRDGEITTFKPYSRYPPCYKDMSFWVSAKQQAAVPVAASGGGSGRGTESVGSRASAGEGESGDKGGEEAGVSAAGGLEPSAITTTTTTPVGGKDKAFHENDYCEIVREVAGDLVETVTLIDEFTHPKTGRQSKAYRINYRSMDRSLSNEEVNALHAQVQDRLVADMGIEIR
ncbi:Phenylalanine--tRNA ligase, mitochondrial [Saitozyma sp. JCM 24511]|nr:Phenylalanine--tRNA ligase, mitochondrial [Saitozyma sp. JCM 24511]